MSAEAERVVERLWEGLEACSEAGMFLKAVQTEIRNQWVEYHRQRLSDAQKDVRAEVMEG